MAYDPTSWGARCDECILQRMREKEPVGPELHHNAEALVVSEFPKEDEIRAGRPLVGKAGQELDRGLGAVGVMRSDLSYTHAICCQPPANNLEKVVAAWQKENKARKKNDEPLLPSITECCRPRLLNEIKTTAKDGKVNILTLGKPAFQSVTESTISILEVRGGPVNGVLDTHGKFHRVEDEQRADALWIKQAEYAAEKGHTEIPLQVKLLPSLHPAFVLRMMRWMKAFRADLGRAIRWFGGRLEWIEPKITRNPKPEELRKFLSRFSLENPCSCDIETMKERPDDQFYDPLTDVLGCISFADPDEAMVVHFLGLDRKTLFYTDADLLEVSDIIAEFLSNLSVMKEGHNFRYYDRLVLEETFKIVVAPIHDTLVDHKSVESELPHRLAYVGSVYTDTPAWKQGNVAQNAKTDEEWGIYCLRHGNQVVLADGTTRTIHDLVAQRVDVLVKSRNPQTGKIEAKRVVGWHQRLMPEQRWIQIIPEGTLARERGLVVTPEHIVHTMRGRVRADEVGTGDFIYLDEVELSGNQMAAIRGTALGDTSLVVSPAYRKNKRTARSAGLNGSHVTSSMLTQRKVELLAPYAQVLPELPAHEMTAHGRAGWSQPALPFFMPMLRQLAPLLAEYFAENGKRQITEGMFDALGPIGLAWWFMDDGCVQKKVKGRETVCLSLCRYSADDVALCENWFRQKFGAVAAYKDKVLRFSVPASEAFTEYVGKYVFPEARYKLPSHMAIEPYVEIAPSTGQPIAVRVERAGVYAEPNNAEHTRLRARTRYCITVEDNHNFFTTFGLVDNCGRDTAVVSRVAPKLTTILKMKKQEQVAANDHKVMDICAGLHRNGLHVNHEKRRWHDVRLLKLSQKWLAKARAACKDEKFNPGSANAVRDLLFDKWNLVPPESVSKMKRFTKSGLPSTSDEVILALRTSGQLDQEQLHTIEAIRLYRRYSKERGTFILKPRSKYESYELDDFAIDGEVDEDADWENPDEAMASFVLDRFDKAAKKQGMCLADGRIHADFNLGANTGRLSASGINVNNFPVHLRDIIEPAPGNVFVYADGDQIQLRIIASLAKAQAYLDVFNAKGDAHAVTSEALFREKWRGLEKGSPEWEALRNFAKCVTGDTEVFVAGRGPVAIRALQPCPMRAGEDVACHIPVFGADGRVVWAERFYYGGVQPIFKLMTQKGKVLRGTGKHRLLNVQKEWRRLDEIRPGEKLYDFFLSFRDGVGVSDEVVSIERAGEEEVYDLVVPDGNAFAANGLISHNTWTYAVAFGAELPTVLATIRSTETPNGDLPYAKMTLKEVRDRYDAFVDMIPFPAWWDGTIERYRKQGYLADPVWGRRRDFADGEDRNALLCYETQASESSIIHEAEFELLEEIPFGRWGHGTGLVTETYDALVVECPASEADYVVDVVNSVMNRYAKGFDDVKFTGKAKVVHSWYEPICGNKECKKEKLIFSNPRGYYCPKCGNFQ